MPQTREEIDSAVAEIDADITRLAGVYEQERAEAENRFHTAKDSLEAQRRQLLRDRDALPA